MFCCILLLHSLPHVGQNLWFYLDSADDIHSLCDSLHPRGVRESALRDELKTNLDAVVKSLTTTSARYIATLTSKVFIYVYLLFIYLFIF